MKRGARKGKSTIARGGASEEASGGRLSDEVEHTGEVQHTVNVPDYPQPNHLIHVSPCTFQFIMLSMHKLCEMCAQCLGEEQTLR
jgi:hypothetical protein